MEKDIPDVLRLLSQVLELHAQLRPDIFVPGTTKYNAQELAEMFTDDYNRLQQLSKDITRALKDEILLTPRVKLVPRGTLPVSEGKAVRVVDKRKVYQ